MITPKFAFTDIYRGLWNDVSRNDIQRRTALAVAHGLVERSSEASIREESEWIDLISRSILGENCPTPQLIEGEARLRGLYVLDPERTALLIHATFGVVHSLEKHVAKIGL